MVVQIVFLLSSIVTVLAQFANSACEPGYFMTPLLSNSSSSSTTSLRASSAIPANQCTPCPAGSFSSTAGSAVCSRAPAGSFVPRAGLSATQPCALATHSGAASCPLTALSASDPALRCSSSQYLLDSICLTPAVGYYAHHDVLYLSSPNPMDFISSGLSPHITNIGTTAFPYTSPYSFLASSSSGQYIVAAGSYSYIYISFDYGRTVYSCAVSPSYWTGLAMSGSGAVIAAISSSDGNVRVSTNYGYYWQIMGMFMFGNSWSSVAVTEHSDNSYTIFVCGSSGVAAIRLPQYDRFTFMESISCQQVVASFSSQQSATAFVLVGTSVYQISSSTPDNAIIVNALSAYAVVAIASAGGTAVYAVIPGSPYYQMCRYDSSTNLNSCETLPTSFSFLGLRADPQGQRLLCIARGNVYLSEDCGSTWNNAALYDTYDIMIINNNYGLASTRGYVYDVYLGPAPAPSPAPSAMPTSPPTIYQRPMPTHKPTVSGGEGGSSPYLYMDLVAIIVPVVGAFCFICLLIRIRRYLLTMFVKDAVVMSGPADPQLVPTIDHACSVPTIVHATPVSTGSSQPFISPKQNAGYVTAAAQPTPNLSAVPVYLALASHSPAELEMMQLSEIGH